jgi:hypothetical protein
LLILYNGGVSIYRGEEKYFIWGREGILVLFLYELLDSEVKKILSFLAKRYQGIVC